jgi:hypothetical protein
LRVSSYLLCVNLLFHAKIAKLGHAKGAKLKHAKDCKVETRKNWRIESLRPLRVFPYLLSVKFLDPIRTFPPL